ncbi:ABC-type transport system involved in multi-copper enzyme maturation permease subunit [Paenibacillus phyllosphaerae]|uniref:ABC-type transport system involved in multi-copper enzyme maturation permease subunit n=1 Tax=Paenibacillus phyllosphaerae TaxID=274593 RepID=A0A7W5AZX8_9BACL|nr:ABC transporter permease subunit [Paenibacillus phyllosphaerae]MBB3111885.1 ABC-type transport system involved in multi-copper enzyme maturation permease subunit [Paenibacillus phyllosphaerae]
MTTILVMTWKELLRKRVMLLTLMMTALFLLAFWFVADTLSLDIPEDPMSGDYLIEQFSRGSFILMLGFFFGSFVVAFLSIFSSFSVIAGEAEQGVMQALMPRPIPRSQWYLGRWLGYVSLGVLYALLLFSAILLVTDVHSNVPRDFGALMKSYLLFASTVPMLISVAMLGSGIFSALGNGVFMTMLYGAGWLGGMIDKVSGSLGLDELVLKPLNNITGIISLIMPSDSIQRRMLSELFSYDEMDGLVNFSSSFNLFSLDRIPSNSFLVYAAIYTVAAFVLGMLRFRRKDL